MLENTQLCEWKRDIEWYCTEIVYGTDRCHRTTFLVSFYKKKKLSEKVTRFTKIEKIRKGNGLKWKRTAAEYITCSIVSCLTVINLKSAKH